MAAKKLTKLSRQKIDEAGALHKEIKEKELRLKILKAELTTSVYENSILVGMGDKFAITFTDTETFADIKPLAALDALKKKGLVDKFYGCIKVQVTPIGKLLSGTELVAIRPSTGSQPRITFKPTGG